MHGEGLLVPRKLQIGPSIGLTHLPWRDVKVRS